MCAHKGPDSAPVLRYDNLHASSRSLKVPYALSGNAALPYIFEMASSVDDPEATSHEISVLHVTGVERVKFRLGKAIHAYVQIDAANYSWRTKDVAWTETGNLRWDDRFTMLPLPSSAKITFSLFRDSRLKPTKPLVGQLEIKLAELLELCARRRGEEISLSLEKKNELMGKLTIRISKASTPALESAIQHLPGVDEDAAGRRLNAAADAISTVAGAVDSPLVESFTSLVASMSLLVKIGDEIAKIHPWANLAWNVLSVGLKLVKAQQDRDTKIAELVQTMRSTYSTVLGSQNIKEDTILLAVLDLILKQTILCGFFIQEYMRPRTLAGKAITENFSSTDSMVVRYLETFKQLRDDYMGRIATHTALITRDIAATVHDIRFDQLMDKLYPAKMDQMNRGVCLPNTRLSVIKSIMNWYSDASEQRENVLWMYGWAGTGKSTLSTTIARMIDELDLLGAFFFFDRQLPEQNFSTLIRTIAYQLAQFDASIGAKVEQVLKHTPNIADLPLATQFAKLLSATALGDIPWSKGPVLVVIDALDESGSIDERKGLLEVLAEGSSNLPPFIRLLIVSRPERDISSRLKRSGVRREELGVDAQTNQADITEFIRARLQEVRQENIEFLPEALQFWPSDYDIQCLAALAAGLFIWAATACRLIYASHDPKESTTKLIEQHSSDIYHSIFTSLHRLYKTALQSAGNWDDKSFCSDFRDILGTIVCAHTPLSCQSVDALLRLPRPSFQTVSRLGSVLRGSREEPIHILHTSFYDYLTIRDSIEPWVINNEQYNMYLANRCIAHLELELHENMCNLTLPHPITNESLTDSVFYASKFWIEHVCSITNIPDNLGHSIYQFMHKHLLHWMEALVIMRAYDVVLQALPRLLAWTQRHLPENRLHHFIRDALRFARYFATTIQEHPLLIYASAVPFTPHNTFIYKIFYHDKLPHVVSGVDPDWPPLLQVLRGHTQHVMSVAWSPDGTKIVSGSQDKTLRVWDALTGREALPPLQGHEGIIVSVVFSPDGSKIVSGSFDKTVRVWDALSGQESLPPLRGHEAFVKAVAISPDGFKIVSGSSDKTVRVWDTLTGQEALPPLQGHESDVWSVGVSSDGSKIVSGSSDKTIRVWDALTGQEALPPIKGHEGSVQCVAFSPDGFQIVSGSMDKTVRVWNVLTGQEAFPPLQGHGSFVYSAAFSPDGLKIVSGSLDKTIRVWDALAGKEMFPPLQVSQSAVYSVAFSPDGYNIASGLSDKTIHVWDSLAMKEALLPPLQGYNILLLSVAFSPDGSKIVSGSDDNIIRVWDALTGEEALAPLHGHEDWVRTVAWSPDGFQIVSGSDDKTIRVWDALTGQEVLPPLQGHEDAVRCVAFSPDGLNIVSGSGSADKTIRIWNALTGKEISPPLQGHRASVLCIAHSPDGSKIVSGSFDKTVRVWDAITGLEALRPLQGHEGEVWSIGFSPNGSKIVSGSWDGTIRIWDAITGQETLPPLQWHEVSQLPFNVSFTPDGSKIVAVSRSAKAVRVWDALTGQVQALSVLSSPANSQPQSLIHLGEDQYFVDVSTGRHLCKVPTGFEIHTYDFPIGHGWHESLNGGVGWTDYGTGNIPVVIQFSLS